MNPRLLAVVVTAAVLAVPATVYAATSSNNYTPPCVQNSDSCRNQRIVALESAVSALQKSSASPQSTTPAPTAPTSTPPSSSTTSSRPPQGTVPGQLLDLSNWYLTLPTPLAQTSGDPDTILQPALDTYSSPFFQALPSGAVRFTAPAGGAHTANSSYPRSELREMTNGGKTDAAWSSSSGTSTMTIREAIMQEPPTKPQVVMGQIHNASDDVIEILADGSNGHAAAPAIKVRFKGSSQSTPVIASVTLGQFFDIKIVATDGQITIYGNGVLTHTFAYSGSGLYFKAGAYTQSNPSKGDDANALGQTEISALTVTHV